MRTYLSQGIRHIWNIVGLFCLLYCKPSWMNLAAIWNSHYIRQSRHDSVAGISDMLFYLLEESGYANQKHEVTHTEIGNILRERDVMVEGELETNRCDIDSEKIFNYVVRSISPSTKLERSKKKF